MADSIQMHGQEKLQEFMRRVLDRVEDPSDLWREIAAIVTNNTRQRFRTNIGVDDKPWKQSWRAGLQGGRTLANNGHLRDSIFAKVDGSRITIGTNLKYAALMHFGGVVKPKKGKFLKFQSPLGGWIFLRSVTIPARPYLGISVDDSQEILFEIEEYLEKVLKDAKN